MGEDAAPRPDQQAFSPLPLWLQVPGWISVLGLMLASPFPRLEAPINASGGLGLLTLIGIVFVGKRRLVADRRIRWALLAFFVAGLLSVFVPHLPEWPDSDPIEESLHDFWNLLNAMTAAGLILALARTPRERFTLIFLFCLVMVMIATGVPLERWLTGTISGRVSGTKGGANRYAILVFVSAFWMLLLEAHRWANVSLPRWGLGVAVALIAASPFFLFRRQLEVWEAEPPVLFGSGALALLLLLGGIMLVGVGFTLFVLRGGVWRQVAAWCAIALMFFNGVVGQSRMILIMFAILLTILLSIRIRIKLLLPVLLLLTGLLTSALMMANARFNSTHIKQSIAVRRAIYTEAWWMFRQSPVLGVGFGRRAFRDHWITPPPAPLDAIPDYQDLPFSHAHNLWLHLLATQGVVGFVVFHLLYAALLMHLILVARNLIQENRRGVLLPGDRVSLDALLACVVSLALLQVNGIPMYPLQECNELLLWSLGAVGLAFAAESLEQPTLPLA